MERSDPEYAEAVRFLFDRINYEKTADRPYNQQTFRLARMQFLLQELGNPHLATPVIHIAGTKGKGSVAWLVEEMLRLSGRTTGLYTSPHLIHLEERFVVNGKPISPAEFVEEIDLVRNANQRCADSEHGTPTFFELTTALAWCLFRSRKTDVNVMEVGLGGRLDSTNVCQPCLSIITSISYDHQQQLGETLSLIAAEKAGILKPGIPAIHGARHPEAQSTIRSIADGHQCELWELGIDFECVFESDDQPPESHSTYKSQVPQTVRFQSLSKKLGNHFLPPLSLRMLGSHQADNAAIAIAAWYQLNLQGWDIPFDALARSLAQTQLPARVEVRSQSPLTIVDAAHNIASIQALLDSLNTSFRPSRRTFIFACSKDKQYREILEQLIPNVDRLLVTQYHSNPRTVNVERLEEIAKQVASSSKPQTQILSAPDVQTAYQFASSTAQPDELICITGSFFIAAEAIAEIPSLTNSQS